MTRVRREVTVHELNGRQLEGPLSTLSVASHGHRASWVVLEIGSQTFTVSAQDLQAAIANAIPFEGDVG